MYYKKNGLVQARRFEARHQRDGDGVQEEHEYGVQARVCLDHAEPEHTQLHENDSDGFGGEGPGKTLSVNQNEEDRCAESVVHDRCAFEGGERNGDGLFSLFLWSIRTTRSPRWRWRRGERR